MAISGLTPTAFARATADGLRPVTPMRYARSQGSAFHKQTPVAFAKRLRHAKPSRWTEIVKTKLITQQSLHNMVKQRAEHARNVVSPAQLARRCAVGTRVNLIA